MTIPVAIGRTRDAVRAQVAPGGAAGPGASWDAAERLCTHAARACGDANTVHLQLALLDGVGHRGRDLGRAQLATALEDVQRSLEESGRAMQEALREGAREASEALRQALDELDRALADPNFVR